MKTMTCKQLGGPCDAKLTGDTADEIMNQGTQHIMATKDADPEHKKAFDMMQESQQKPELAKVWYDKLVADFNALPND